MTEGHTEVSAKKSSSFWGPVWAIFWTIAVFLGGQFLGGMIFAIFGQIFYGDDYSTRQLGTIGLFTVNIMAYGTILALLWVLLRRRNFTFKTIGLKKPQLSDVTWAFAGFFAYMVLYIAVALIAQAIFPNIDFEQQQELGFNRSQSGFGLLLVFVALVVMPPLVEEIIMRGFLYKGLRTKFSFIPTALIISVLFAIAHLQFDSNAPLLWTAAIDTFALSIILVYLRERSKSLAAPILLHALKNGIAFTLIFVFAVG